MALADDIIEKVDQKETDTQKLRTRWAIDYEKRWLLDTYSPEGLRGYETHTSNDPRTMAQKGISLLSGSAMTVQTPQENDARSARDDDNAKERFILGNFRANDARLALIGQPSLRQHMSFTMPIFGHTMGRALLMKRDGRAWADATPWDPKEVMWEFGHDGLLWICHKYYRMPNQVEAEYGVRFGPDRNKRDPVLIYDYYDDEKNTITIPALRSVSGALVKSLRHGQDRTPGWVVMSTLQPPIVRTGVGGEGGLGFAYSPQIMNVQLADSLADYGESIFASNRSTWDDNNYVMSIQKELVHRSLKPVFGIRSADGVKLVEGDPFKAGAEIPLAAGEELIVYDFIKAAGDTNPYLSLINGQLQRGGFPVIMFGETPATISGFAMNTLKSGVGDRVLPDAQAISTALRQVSNLWVDHFVTGAFGSMELSGQGRNRRWFSATITPMDIEDLPEVEIILRPQLPEDNASKINQAQLLRQPGPSGQPLMSDYRIREEVLELQDSDLEMDAIFQEMAIQNPLVQAQRLTDALAKRGDEGAKWWHIQFQMLLNQMMQAAMQGGVSPEMLNAPTPNTNESAGGNLPPEFLPNALQGIPPPTPGLQTPGQAGPLVPPGTPRPGAQQNGALRTGVPPLP